MKRFQEGHPKDAKDLSNCDIVTLAVYLTGGESHYIDTEDIAIKANEIAPDRFTWRKYKEQINIDTVRKRLWDVKKDEKGALLRGSEKEGWLLTAAGLKFARKQVERLKGVSLSKGRLNLKERKWRRAERARMLASEAFLKFLRNGLNVVTSQEAEAFFKVDDYVVGAARDRKVFRVLDTFGDDPELGQAVKELANKVRKRESQ